MVRAFDAVMVTENAKERNVEIRQLEDHCKSQNLIADRLPDEITSLHPTSMDTDIIANNNKIDLAMFKETVGTFCDPGRCFNSCFQFHQFMKLLCSQWNISMVAFCNSIRCHHMERKQKCALHINPAKRRKQQVLCCNHHFIIRHSLPVLVRNKKNKSRKRRIVCKVISICNNVFAHI